MADDDRLVELLRLLVPAPEAWVAEAHEIAEFAPADEECGDDEDGATHDQDRVEMDQGRPDFDDAEDTGGAEDPAEDDGTDPWSV